MRKRLPDFGRLPAGRMLTLLKLEVGLRRGDTYEALAKRLGICLSSSKVWAREFGFRKCDLDQETAEEQAARHASWALALSDLGRQDEAAGYEAEARKLEALLSRLSKRAAKDPERPDPLEPALVFVEKVRAALGPETEVDDVFRHIADYYRGLRALGATLLGDGQARWVKGPPKGELPSTPDWLPCDPWAVLDDAEWEAEVGRALALL